MNVSNKIFFSSLIMHACAFLLIKEFSDYGSDFHLKLLLFFWGAGSIYGVFLFKKYIIQPPPSPLLNTIMLAILYLLMAIPIVLAILFLCLSIALKGVKF